MKKYIEIYNIIKDKIEQNELKHGDRLPSIRKASTLYSVSITTVQNAYFELCADGYIISKDKSGYFVNNIKTINIVENQHTCNTQYKYNLTGGTADSECFDVSLWQRYIKSALRQNERLLSYGEPQGEPDLRQAISKYIYEKRNIITSPEKIVIGAGIQPLIQILCSLLDKNSTVSFPDKSFENGIGIFSDYGFDVHTRDKDADIIYVSPSHMTSWGDVMPIKRRLELVEYSKKHNSLVIEDDYENEFLYNTKPTPSLFTLGSDNIIYLGSFSAMLLPAIRISFMVLNNDLYEKYKIIKYRFSQTAAKTEQIALCNYIRDGHIYSQTRKVRRIYTAKTKYLYSLLNSNSHSYTVSVSENLLQIIIKTNFPVDITEFEKKQIKVYMPNSNTIVLSPVGVSQNDYPDLSNMIKEILENKNNT